MATRYITRSIFTTTRQSITSAIYRSYSTTAVLPNYSSSSSFLTRLRPLVAAAASLRRGSALFSTRGLSTTPTNNSLSDPNPNWSNRPPKETILLDGCDFEHWLVVMDKPEGDPTRDEIIDSYIKTLALVVGSEEEARMKIYSVSTRHYFAFGALVSEELHYKLKELPKVRWVLPDSYLDVRNKDYGGEPFINGEAVPYDPKYHEEWVRNNARANERNRRNDRPRNFDRSRNYDRRGGGPPGNQNPGGNYGGPMQQNNHQQPPGNQNPGGNYGGPMQQNNHQQPPQQPNYGGGAPPANTGNYPPQNNMAPNNQYGNGQNYQPGPGPAQNFNQNYGPNPGSAQGYGGQQQSGYAPNARPPPPVQNPNYPPNMGHGGMQNQSYAPNAGGNQNVPGRDMPHSPTY